MEVSKKIEIFIIISKYSFQQRCLVIFIIPLECISRYLYIFCHKYEYACFFL